MWWSQLELVLAIHGARLGKWWPARMLAQSTVEYALVGALVVIAAAGALTVLSGEINAVFGNISNTLKAAATTPH